MGLKQFPSTVFSTFFSFNKFPLEIFKYNSNLPYHTGGSLKYVDITIYDGGSKSQFSVDSFLRWHL